MVDLARAHRLKGPATADHLAGARDEDERARAEGAHREQSAEADGVSTHGSTSEGVSWSSIARCVPRLRPANGGHSRGLGVLDCAMLSLARTRAPLTVSGYPGDEPCGSLCGMEGSRTTNGARVALVGPELEENLSLRYLASSLARAGHSSDIVAFNRERDLPRALRAILEPRDGSGPPPVVGLSLAFQWRARDFLGL